MTVLLDDHLLRDWLGGADEALQHAIGGGAVATTNLWYVRLCKGMAARRHAELANWPDRERQALVARLVALPDWVTVVPMRQLAWRMGELIAPMAGSRRWGRRPSASALTLDARVLVSSRNVGPGIERCCEAVGVRHVTAAR